MNFTELTEKYLHDLWEIRDVRMDSYPLMSSPLPTIALSLTYVFLVTVAGPKLMARRQPFTLKTVMTIYNLLQMLFSAWVLWGALVGGWWNHYSFRCQPVEYSDVEATAVTMAKVSWLFYFGRFFEFIDTFLFVARKKFDQVSFLHVSHHAIMPVFLWPWVRYMPGGHGTFAGLLNSGVHVLMYGYYLLSCLGYHELLWWKKHLTKLQLIQFVLVLFHNLQLLLPFLAPDPDCSYPKGQAACMVALMLFFLALFVDFYRKAYYRNKKDKSG